MAANPGDSPRHFYSLDEYFSGEKFVAYQQIAEFREYLIVSQEAPRITHWLRQSNGTWASNDVSGMGTLVRLESIDCELSLTEIYRGVSVSTTP